jgi:hypothetical protein
MATVFWDMEGILLIEYLTEGATITGQLCNYQKIMLLRDNCRVHKARQIREVINECGFVEMEQPAYSPDLAPNDYYLFLNFFFFG